MNNFIESKFKIAAKLLLILPVCFFLCWINSNANPYSRNGELPVKSKRPLTDTAKIWQASINKDTLHFEFDYLSRGIDQSSTWFLFSQFAGLNQTTGHNFFVTCDAGSIYFNGVLQKGEGHGRYKFIPNKDYKALVEKVCSESVNDHALFTLLIFHVTIDYLEKLNSTGVNDMTVDKLIRFYPAT